MINFIVIAGFPHDIYDAVISMQPKRLVGETGVLVSSPLGQRADGTFCYTLAYTNGLLKKLYTKYCESDTRQNDPSFSVLYIDHECSEKLKNEFLNFSLLRRVSEFDFRKSGRDRRIEKNRLIETLPRLVKSQIERIRQIKSELQNKRNKTPLLLPRHNFVSTVLPAVLAELAEALATNDDVISEMRSCAARVESCHKRVAIGKKSYLSDERNLVFVAPAPGALHGVAQGSAQQGHWPACNFRGRARLGAPFDRSFHYDCQKIGRTVSGQFPSCHRQMIEVYKKTHLNIAPNDHVRPPA